MKRNHFSKEFKIEAVRLLKSGKKAGTAIARELGIPRNKLYLWQDQIDAHGEDTAFPGHGRRASSDKQAQEHAHLQKELARLKEENDILKKAAIFFARDLK